MEFFSSGGTSSEFIRRWENKTAFTVTVPTRIDQGDQTSNLDGCSDFRNGKDLVRRQNQIPA